MIVSVIDTGKEIEIEDVTAITTKGQWFQLAFRDGSTDNIQAGNFVRVRHQ